VGFFMPSPGAACEQTALMNTAKGTSDSAPCFGATSRRISKMVGHKGTHVQVSEGGPSAQQGSCIGKAVDAKPPSLF